MMIALSSKNKTCFIDASLTKPSANSPNLRAWERVNNTVIGWILVVLESSIAKSVLLYSTAREIWVELEERYGLSSLAQQFSLLEKISAVT